MLVIVFPALTLVEGYGGRAGGLTLILAALEGRGGGAGASLEGSDSSSMVVE